MTSTYTKLKDGNWGIRVPGSAKAGQQVTITKKECGRMFTYSDAKRDGGDWSDGYCGC